MVRLDENSLNTLFETLEDREVNFKAANVGCEELSP